MKNSNLFLAVAVSIGFIALWDLFVVPRYTPKATPAPAHATTATGGAAKPAATAPIQGNMTVSTSKEKGPDQMTLKADKVEIVVESKGAAISQWKVQEQDGNWIELILTPVLITFPDVPSTLMQKSDRVVVMTTHHPDGFRLTKTFTLLEEPPFHTLSVTVTNTSGAAKDVVVPLSWPGGLHKHLVGADLKNRDADAARAEMRVVAFRDRPQSWKAGLLFNRSVDTDFMGPFEWVGSDNHHFLAALLSKGGAIAKLHVTANRSKAPAFEVPVVFSLAPGESKTEVFQLYVGPKKLSALKDFGHHLDGAVNFGTFGVISRTLLRTLEFFKSLTQNYGWAIIMLTVCIQILMFPLTKTSLSHSVRMKELQPQIKLIQEQYKNDQKRIQVEMFNLYRKNGMKFMGMEGCFPILLQLPVFFAFYTTLNVAYELRGASWLWIPDLGLHDPHYILPVFMGIGMFLQQRFTTVAADPAQAKMMMFMPVIMTFMFLKLPAGLVLYWSVNSICTIVIQKFLQWRRHAAPRTA